MRTRILILLLFLLPVGKILVAQGPFLSTEATISLLTCGPGPEVYSYFGHSALRVTDPVLKIDRVYNYGTFDFNVPDFYARFINGKLNYMLSVVRYQGFFPDYISENRFIKELTLNLTLEQKQILFYLLEINYLPENRYYWYDFFIDNCSTRIRDIVVKATEGKFLWPPEPAEHLTYRQLIMPYISLNNWAKTGILLMLAAGTDREASQEGYMFLPDHMHRLFSQARQADGTPLCKPEKIIFEPEYPKPIGTGLFHPYTFFTILLIISWIIAFYKKIPSTVTKSFYTILFFISGSLGLLFCYMWFFTAHVVCHANLNLAWAFPLNIFLAFAIWFPKAGMVNRPYSKAMLVLILLLLATFYLWKQKIPFEAILFCLTLLPGLFRFSGFKIFRNTKAQD
ncbi:MAG: DUF4105 domain-containing protein, partial [Bacteroidia bacterium]|nr:DUF4105 domain-containing protein [Bacteroidia bacterium]